MQTTNRDEILKRYATTVVIIALFLPLCFACDLGFTSEAYVSQCSTDIHGLQTCTATNQLSFSIDYPGQSICIDLVDATLDPPIPLGLVTIDYIMWTCVGTPNLMYYTHNFVVEAQSEQYCFGTGICSDSECTFQNTHSESDRNAQNTLSNPNLWHSVGQTICDRVMPETGDGCVHFDTPGCVYSGWYIRQDPGNPKVPHESFGVYNFPSQTCGAVMNYTLQIYNELDYTSDIGFAHIPTTYNVDQGGLNATMTIDGTIGNSFSCFDLTSIPAVISPGFKYVLEVSDVNFPEAGKVGDVQETDSGEAGFYNTTTIIDNSVAYIVSESLANGAVWGQVEAGIARCYNYNAVCRSLPYSPDGFTNLVAGVDTNLPANQQLVSISSVCQDGPGIIGNLLVQNITFQRVYDVCEFSCDFDSLYGCYDCDTCAFISLQCTYSEACSVTISSPDLNLKISQTHLANELNIPFCSSYITIDSSITLTSGDFSQKIDIKGTLQDPVVMLYDFNDTFIYAYNYDLENNGFGDAMGSFFDDLFNGHWWSFIIFGIVIIAAICLLLFLLYLAFCICIPAMIAKSSMKKTV